MKNIFKIALFFIMVSTHEVYAKEQQESAFIKGGRRMVFAESALLGVYGAYKMGERVGRLTESSEYSRLYSFSTQNGMQTLLVCDCMLTLDAESRLPMFAGASGLEAPFSIAEDFDHFKTELNHYKPVIQKSVPKQVVEAAGWGIIGIGLCAGAAMAVGNMPVEKSTPACTALYGAFVAAASMENNR